MDIRRERREEAAPRKWSRSRVRARDCRRSTRRDARPRAVPTPPCLSLAYCLGGRTGAPCCGRPVQPVWEERARQPLRVCATVLPLAPCLFTWPHVLSPGHSWQQHEEARRDAVNAELMELQQQGMPRYGLYGSHYDQAQGFPGQGRHPLSGGYPFPPMPGQNYSGYPHLGYPSSQSPNPREGKISDLLIPVVCVCQPRFWTCAISGRFDYFLKFAYTQDIFAC